MIEQRNLILAVGLSLAILIGFNYLYERPKQLQLTQQTELTQTPQPKEASAPASQSQQQEILPRQEALALSQRITIHAPKVHGSINLLGGRLDDLTLADYHETTDPKSPEITLLSPESTKGSYFADFGWLGEGNLPNAKTEWKVAGDASQLTMEKPVTLFWENGAGLRFERTFAVDENYLFTITERVINKSGKEVSLQPFSQITRLDMPPTSGYFILHEGAVGVINSRLNEVDYQKLLKEKNVSHTTTGGWTGFTDKYWLVALIPVQKTPVQVNIKGDKTDRENFASNILAPKLSVQPGQSIEHKQHLFAGAKVLRLLDAYEEKLGFDHFDLAVDFGWFYFLTKPLFYVLEFFHQLLGNLGLAILALTILVKALFFPLANKSFRSMARMKAMQPHMERLKERYANDKVRLNQELMELYKKQKINPVSGCLPMLIQAPIFFCLYKVFFVTIEMRHAPFYGWIHDLSAPDPTSFFNLFGLLPWDPPSFLMIGAWPLLMGATMLLQQRLNPQPTDPTQAKMMLIMPIMFTYLFASFPAGLVIYWAWSNILTITQQILITRVAQRQPAVITAKAVGRSKKK